MRDQSNKYRVGICTTVISIAVAGCGGGGGAENSSSSNSTAIAACNSYVPGTVQQNDFVCAHNDVRATASPTPSPALQGLVWDANLAKVAKAWANNCDFSHNPNRATEYNSYASTTTTVGENIYATTAATVSPYTAVNAWASEASDYNYSSNTCASGKVCGHYTQLVWRNSGKVGCGVSFCTNLSNTSFINSQLVVCNYEPAGNFVGQKPY